MSSTWCKAAASNSRGCCSGSWAWRRTRRNGRSTSSRRAALARAADRFTALGKRARLGGRALLFARLCVLAAVAGAGPAGAGGLAGGCRTLRGWPRGGRAASQAATFFHRRLVELVAAARAAGFFSAASDLVHGGPGPPLGLVLRHAALLVPLFDVLGLPLLFVGVFRFVVARHG